MPHNLTSGGGNYFFHFKSFGSPTARRRMVLNLRLMLVYLTLARLPEAASMEAESPHQHIQ